MTPQQIALVQETFAQVRPIADTAAALFYNRLFMLDPSLRPMFKGDMVRQGQMLMQMLGAATSGLTNLPKLAPVVRQLGARHTGYGVTDDHYATVGAALIWTLEQGLGEQFTPEVHDAWAAAYRILSETMKAGAAEAVPV